MFYLRITPIIIGVMIHACNPSTWEVPGGLGVRGSPGYIVGPYLKKDSHSFNKCLVKACCVPHTVFSTRVAQ
jgi:hypothetical protein